MRIHPLAYARGLLRRRIKYWLSLNSKIKGGMGWLVIIQRSEIPTPQCKGEHPWLK